MVGLRFLVPYIEVRVLVRQHMNIDTVQRVCYGSVMACMALLCPLWVTIIFCVFGIVLFSWYMEVYLISGVALQISNQQFGQMWIIWVFYIGIVVLELCKHSLWNHNYETI